MNSLETLQTVGQSIWLDFITRRFITDGQLAAHVKEDGLRGVTSNPTIFQKAIAQSNDYDSVIQNLLTQNQSSTSIFEEIAISDIQKACDVFGPVYAQTKGQDGFVSLEVNPHLARDTQGTIEEAARLAKRVNRSNLMIKIPATVEGLPAITESLAQGISINITLIFSLERHQQVMEAWGARARKSTQTRQAFAIVSVGG